MLGVQAIIHIEHPFLHQRRQISQKPRTRRQEDTQITRCDLMAATVLFKHGAQHHGEHCLEAIERHRTVSTQQTFARGTTQR